MRSLLRLAFVWLAALLAPCKGDGCCPFCGWEDDE